MARQLLLASSSRCHPYDYLDHCESEVRQLFSGASEIVFVPYARPGGESHAAYTDVARKRFAHFGINVRGIDAFDNPRTAVADAQGIFIGGGNTFVLLRDLYEYELIDVLRTRILQGMPYLGTSAGSNVAGVTIGTSNDMPIVQPASFKAFGVVPFNLNPHFPAAKPDPTHRGETREDRIAEFHAFNSQPVVALHEDGMLRIDGDHTRLIGQRPAFVFRAGRDVQTVSPGPILDEDLLANQF